MRAIILAAAVTIIGGGCAIGPAMPGPAPLPLCQGDVITVHGDEPTGCDLTPPQRLDVLDVTLAECDHMGGEYVLRSSDGRFACEDVDY